MSINNSNISKILLPLAALTKNNAIVAAFSYFLTITLANHLGPLQFGVYSHVLIVASVISIFINFGSDQTAAILHSKLGSVSKVFCKIYIMRLAIAVPTLTFLAIIYFENFLFIYFVMCLTLSNYNLSFLYEIRRCNVKYSYIYLIERLAYVGGAFVLLYLNRLELNYLFPMLFFVTAASILFQLIDNSSKMHILQINSDKKIFEYAQENMPIVVIALSMFVYGGFSRLVLEDKLGSEQLGIYSAGWQLITIGTIFQAQVSRLWRAKISDAVYTLNKESLLNITKSYIYFSTLPMIFACCVVIFLSESIVAFIFNYRYMGLVDILPIFGVYLVVINLTGFVDMLWVALRRNIVYMLTSLFFGAMLLAYYLLFSSRLTMANIAVSVVFCHFIATLTLTILWVRAFRLRLNGILPMVVEK